MGAWVVFLRGVNVGGHRKFKPSVLAGALDAENLGAAGTWVLRRRIAVSALRREILRRLPFQAEVMVCDASDVAALRWSRAPAGGVKRFVSVLSRPLSKPPALPMAVPAKGRWQVRIVRVSGPFAFSEFRKAGARLLYPNEVVERAFGVPATTRAWSTIVALQRLIDGR